MGVSPLPLVSKTQQNQKSKVLRLAFDELIGKQRLNDLIFMLPT
jgi:hypothetical protein